MTQDEELSRLMVLIEQYKEQLNQIDMQVSYLQSAINEYNKSKITIQSIEKQDKNSDMLFPIGGGSYIDAKAKDPSKILFDIGAGYVVQKKTNDALKKIDDRIKELEKNMEKIEQIRQKTQNEASEVYQKAQRMYQEQNK